VGLVKDFVMIGSRRAIARLAAAGTLAAILLLPVRWASAIDGLIPDNGLRPAWSPSRDDAVLVDSQPTVRVAQHAEIAEEALPVESPLRTSRLMQRPRSLSRPAPGQARIIGQPTSIGEPLPSVAGTPLSPEGLPVPPVAEYYPEGELMGYGGGACTECGCPALCGPCGPADCCGQWNSCGPVPPCYLLPRIPRTGLEFFGGVQGFTGPLNRGGSGSFGFHEGFNWGFPACGCLAWQWGANWTQNNFDGNFLTTDSRNQVFVTGGMFRRVDWGLQGGLVVDYMHDEWDYEADLLQLRGEISWRWCCMHELGFWFTGGVNDADDLLLNEPALDSSVVIGIFTGQATIEVNDMYAFFYRRQFATGGEGRVFGGFTANNQGLLGVDMQLPINHCWSARAGFLYVTPDSDETPDRPNFTEETWNVGISLVWTPCPRPPCTPNYCRPLFNVADNGSFITRLVSPPLDNNGVDE
jgi:hypothetical protein